VSGVVGRFLQQGKRDRIGGRGIGHSLHAGRAPIVDAFNSRRRLAMSEPKDSPDLQGEGNYDATRRYDKAAREFAQSGKVDEAARRAEPSSPQEAEELERAERAGQSHSKGEDPQITTPGSPPRK
jgi:hypothetical protein